MVGEVQERAAKCPGVMLQLDRHRLSHRTRGLREIGVLLAIIEPSRNATDGGVNRQHRMVGREEQHPVGAALAHLRQTFERSAGRRQRTANHLRQIRRASESVDARPQRKEALLGVRTGQLDALLELFLRRARHRVGRERPDPPERAEGRVALPRCGVNRQYLPDEQAERIVRRRGKRSVKPLERIDERFESGQRMCPRWRRAFRPVRRPARSRRTGPPTR